MSESPKRYDPYSLTSTYHANGGDALLENCNQSADEPVYFSSENVRHPGTVRQQKIRFSRAGFKLVLIEYTHADGSALRSIKYMLLNGEEYRAENTPHNTYSLRE